MRHRKIIRLSAILLTVAAAVQLCGCAAIADIQNGAPLSQVFSSFYADLFGEEDAPYTEVSVTLPRHPGYAAVEDKTAFASLRSDEERQAYLSIEQSVFRVTDLPGEEEGTYQLSRALIPSLSSVQIFKVKEAVLADHPEAFWLNGGYTLGRNAHDGLYIILFSSMSAEDIAPRAAALAEKVSLIMRQIKSGLNEYDREMIIHDSVVRDVQYDEEAAADVSHNDPSANVYGTLVNGRAICTGYARTVKLLLNRVGISCMTVKGICREEGHMWNLVSIDGSWYHLDITWNDPTEFSAYGMLSHNYFNLTDADITSNHEISPDYSMLTESMVEGQGEDAQNFYNFDLPACTAVDGNYYRRNAIYISHLNDSEAEHVTRAIRLCALMKQDICYLVFPENYQDVAVLENWFNSATLSAIDTVNRELREKGSDYVIDTYKYSSFTDDNWCNAYIFKLLYDEQTS